MIILLVILPAGCTDNVSAPSGSGSILVPIAATRNFGREVIFERFALVKEGDSAQTAVEEVADVTMAGSFIESIDTLTGDTEYYWLYYINGILANVFAGGYPLHDGDMQHWDFHDYSYSMHGSSAIIGDFPEPFLHGYGGVTYPVIIVYTEGFQAEAERIKELLDGLDIKDVSVKNAAAVTEDERESNNLIIVSTMESEMIARMNKSYRGLALFAHFDEDKVEALNAKGRVEAEYGAGTGVIQAVQNIWNPKGSWACESVVWMISGIDKEGVQQAVETLINQTKMEYAFGVIIADGDVIRVPVPTTVGDPINWQLICITAGVVAGAVFLVVRKQRSYIKELEREEAEDI